MANDPSSYEEIPYPVFSFPQTHPRRLHAIAHLFGLEAPTIERCRVLEIGCAGGGNIVPIAYSLPEASFVGIDISPGQIADARSFSQGAGLNNLDLRIASLSEVSSDWGQFDYIIAHGVFSWVAPEVADQLLQLCGQRLSDRGLAYISLNTYPGWHAREWIRNAMLFHVRKMSDSQQRIAKARSFVNMLAESPFVTPVIGQVLRGEAEYLKKQPDGFVAHDHLESENHPIYFRDFAARAAANGLQYLADASQNLGPEALWPAALQWLRDNPDDLVASEQFADFINGRAFRRAVLCRSGLALDRGSMPTRFGHMWARGYLRRTDQKDGSTRFDMPGLNFHFMTRSPAVRAALSRLFDSYPGGVAVGELLSMGPSAEIFPALMYCWCSGRIVLHIEPPPMPPRKPSDHPRASSICRYIIAQKRPPINLRQETVKLSTEAAQLVAWLDGSRGQSELPRAAGMSPNNVERALRELAAASVLEA